MVGHLCHLTLPQHLQAPSESCQLLGYAWPPNCCLVKEATQVHDSHSKIRHLLESAELTLSLEGEPSPRLYRKPGVEALETGGRSDKVTLILNYRANLRPAWAT